MRDNRWEDPTLDPVERERILLRQTRVVEERPQVVPSEWTLSRRIAVLVCVGLVAVYLVIWAGNVQTSGGPEGYVHTTDFIAPLTGAQIVQDGNATQLYDTNTQRSTQSSLVAPFGPLTSLVPFDHAPFEVILLSPLLNLPSWFVFALWTMTTGLAIGLAVGLLDGALPVSRPVGWAMSMAACSFLPVIRSLMLGQDIAFVLLGICGAFTALKRGFSGWAALSLLLVAFRPTLLPVVILLLLLDGHFRTLGTFLVLLVALVVAAMPVLGPTWPLQYVSFLAQNGAGASGVAGHNWLGFTSEVFGGSSSGFGTPVFAILSLASAGVLVWAWLRSHDTDVSVHNPELFDYEPASDLLWAAAGIVVVLTSFHPGEDDLALLVFPAWIIGAYATSGLWPAGISRLWIAILSVGYILAPLAAYAGTDPARVNSVLVLYVPVLALALVLLAWQMTSPPESSIGTSGAPAGT